jgi:hypothetical protein
VRVALAAAAEPGPALLEPAVLVEPPLTLAGEALAGATAAPDARRRLRERPRERLL